jgi:hypothetical protein
MVALEAEKLLAVEAKERQGMRTDIRTKMSLGSMGKASAHAAKLVDVGAVAFASGRHEPAVDQSVRRDSQDVAPCRRDDDAPVRADFDSRACFQDSANNRAGRVNASRFDATRRQNKFSRPHLPTLRPRLRSVAIALPWNGCAWLLGNPK